MAPDEGLHVSHSKVPAHLDKLLLGTAWAILLKDYKASTEISFNVAVTEQSGAGICTTRTARVVLDMGSTQTLAQVSSALARGWAADDNAQQWPHQDGLSSAIWICPGGVNNVSERSSSGGSEITGRSSHDQSLDTSMMTVKCTSTGAASDLTISCPTHIMDEFQLERMSRQLAQVVSRVREHADSTLVGTITTVCAFDIDEINTWNGMLPRAVQVPVGSLFTRWVQMTPDAKAIASWDGTLTYKELDSFSSALCRRLWAEGVTTGVIVPLMFERSMWTTVAVMAVVKSGAAFTLLDPELPDERLKELVRQTSIKPSPVLASRATSARASAFGLGLITVDSTIALDTQISSQASSKCTHLNLLYVVFTSGTTGTPKGVMITHGNVATLVTHQSPMLGIHRSSRLLDIASYAFDVAISNCFKTLLNGACLCVPSHTEWRNDLTAVFDRYQVTYAEVTPSIAKLLKPSELSTLEVLNLGGEAVTDSHIQEWRDSSVRLYNTYGPAECTITTVINLDLRRTHAANIGRAIGVLSWIVDPADTERLLPVGATGELLLEGPLVGKGYLSNAEKTATAFIDAPVWLRAYNFADGSESRGLLYRTGDLVRYGTDGSIEFRGRADSQVKVRGQRIELGEVEHHLRNHLPPAIWPTPEVVRLQTGSELLVAFIPFGRDAEKRLQFRAMLDSLQQSLTVSLPSVMIPGAYLGVDTIPLSPTGKTDRRKLKSIASETPLEDIMVPGQRGELEYSAGVEVMTPEELSLRRLWAGVLNLEMSAIRTTSDFFALGGQSMAAIKLVGAARKTGLRLKFETIFQHSQLHGMARELKQFQSSPSKRMPSFYLLPDKPPRSSMIEEISSCCTVSTSQIEDAYPCTPMQQGLIAKSDGDSSKYVGRTIIKLADSVDIAQFKSAWEKVYQTQAILRTRIAYTESAGWTQAVLQSDRVPWTESKSLSQYIKDDRQLPMAVGTALFRCALISESGITHFALTIHHAIYDGWTLPRINTLVFKAYCGNQPPPNPPINTYIEWANSQSSENSSNFWKIQLINSQDAVVFPSLPSSASQPGADSLGTFGIELPSGRPLGFSMPSLIRTAWAILISRLTGSEDVIFGATVSGRTVPVPGIEDVLCPTISTVPVRIAFQGDMTVRQLLLMVQERIFQSMPYEYFGLQNIRRINDTARRACQFQSLLVVQPLDCQSAPMFPTTESEKKLFDALYSMNVSTALADFNEYPLMVIVTQEAERLKLEISYDSCIMNLEHVQQLASQLTHVVTQICTTKMLDKPLHQLDCVSVEEIEKIWSWNAMVPEGSDALIHEQIRLAAHLAPEKQAICAWDGCFTYSELDEKSDALARTLTSQGAFAGNVVAICLEKSSWATLSMLAILKTGAAFVALDARNQPIQRVSTMAKEAQAILVLTSRTNLRLAEKLELPTIVLDASLEVAELPVSFEPTSTTSSNTAFLVFTSGSTGVPKGIKITHKNFCSATRYHGERLGLNQDSRVYDYASYSFDIAMHNSLATLSVGGCVCIPSEDQRDNHIEQSMVALEVNWADLTPSIARLLDPLAVPSLRTLVLSGEAVGGDLVLRWPPQVQLVNAYGPAECQICTINPGPIDSKDPSNIGFGVGCTTWIVDPSRGTLAPIGALGELVIEGPIVSPGYQSLTSESWITDPCWLSAGSSLCTGRRGLVYATGDLARYQPDGSITFHGRIDSQRKVYGQRVELGEIEAHILSCEVGLQSVAVEIVKHESISMLSAFLHYASDVGAADKSRESPLDEASALPSMDFLGHAPKLSDNLAKVLPDYMLPKVFFAVSRIPLTPSRKVDRKMLVQMSQTLSRVVSYAQPEQPQGHLSLTGAEIEMQRHWSQLLMLSPGSVCKTSNFFELGGDSIVAMQLVRKARIRWPHLTVAKIFRHPRLAGLVSAIETNDSMSAVFRSNIMAIPCFALIPQGIDIASIIRQAALSCDIEPSAIQDIYPTVSLQEGLMAMTAKDASAYVHHGVMKVSSPADLERLVQAWTLVQDSHAILRTRIAQIGSLGLVQVVLKAAHPISWPEQAANSDAGIVDVQFRLGSPLFQLQIDPVSMENRAHTLRWTIHHALYDAWTLRMIVQDVLRAYREEKLILGPSFNVFVQHVRNQHHLSTLYWSTALAGALEAAVFPETPRERSYSRNYQQTERLMPLSGSKKTVFAISSIIRASWAFLMRRLTGSDRVVFGETRLGRDVSIDAIEQLRGPTSATVPVMVQIDEDQTLERYISDLQNQKLSSGAHEHYGLENIAKINEETKAACEFQTLLVIQPTGSGPQEQAADATSAFTIEDGDDELHAFNSYSLLIFITQTEHELYVEASYDSGVLNAAAVAFILQQLEVVIWSMREGSLHRIVAQLDHAGSFDLDRIWEDNAQELRPNQRLVHDMISEQSRKTPHALAVLAHDGQLTYQQLENYSTALSLRLHDLGVTRNSFVPLCFEKSAMVPMCMMAVLKAGAAFTAMDVSHPEDYLRSLVERLGAPVVLTSPLQQSLASRLHTNTLCVNSRVCSETQSDRNIEFDSDPLHDSDPNRVMYVAFTSGSSGGAPKGVMVSHQNLATACQYQARDLGFSESSKVFDFSSYSFDATIWHTFLALTTGGCLCTPSETARIENLAGAITSLDSSIGFLTPSLARTLDPRKLPTLKRLFLGGEAVTPLDVSIWAEHLELMGAYGPTEVTPLCIFNKDLGASAQASWIGFGLGVRAWVTKPSDVNQLVAYGSVGELVVEGPLVTLGYHDDPEKTAAAFVRSPDFLVKGSVRYRGRQGYVYRTGDLVRYLENGCLDYIGRGDTQAKLRGQRVDFGDIQYHLKKAIPSANGIIAEMIEPSDGRQVLVAFVSFAPGATDVPYQTVQRLLGQSMPSYKIPAAFIRVDDIPMSAAGKVDRQRLKRIGPKLLQQQTRPFSGLVETSSTAASWTTKELHLRALWAKVLGVDEETIERDADFFQVGGESIAAMKLSAIAREQGTELAVASIFQYPELSRMVLSLGSSAGCQTQTPFSLLPTCDLDGLVQAVAASCAVSCDSIEDVYPCSPMQEALMHSTLKRQGAYTRRSVFQLSSGVSLDALIEAWDVIVAANGLLRTRVVQSDALGLLLQVVTRHGSSWTHSTDLAASLVQQKRALIGFGSPLATWEAVREMSGAKIVMTMHHALYDGWSTRLLEDQLQRAYKGTALPKATPFNRFIRFLAAQDQRASEDFWANRLRNARQATVFPPIPPDSSQVSPKEIIRTTVRSRPHPGMSLQAMIHVSWALVVARLTGASRVLFGATLAGRDSALPDIENIVGPTFTTVPIQIDVNPDIKRSISDLVGSVQQEAAIAIPFQHFGMQNIASVNQDTAMACRFQTLIVVIPNEDIGGGLGEKVQLSSYEVTSQDSDDAFHTFALVLSIIHSCESLEIECAFDPLVVPRAYVERLIENLERTLDQVSDKHNGAKLVSDIETAGARDMSEIWKWNATVPISSEQTIYDLISQSARLRQLEVAVDAWDCVLTFEALLRKSSALCDVLSASGVTRGSIVPVLTTKSGWVPVAALAVLRAGGTVLGLDIHDSHKRIKAILDQVSANVVLTTRHSQADVSGFATNVHVIEESTGSHAQQNPSQAHPDDVASIIYTSDTTGAPKGIPLSHRQICSAIHHQASAIGLNDKTRVFEFASYNFDHSWHAIFGAMCTGACLCVPSETARQNDLCGSLNDFRADFVALTPSVARLLDPSSLPGLRTLVLAGEAVNLQDFQHWTPNVRLVNGYGPAECTAFSTLNPGHASTAAEHDIGKGAGVVTWVTEPHNHNLLAPIGAVGELVLEGPLVGLGYFQDDASTAAKYVMDPPWLLEGHKGLYKRSAKVFKTGDLVSYDYMGNLHFHSRMDTQVKINGQRVELAGIQHAILSTQDGWLHEVVVDYSPILGTIDRSLIAYLVPGGLLGEAKALAPSEQMQKAVQDLKARLTKKLPRHAIPSTYFFVASIPRTISGKSDRKTLAALATTAMKFLLRPGSGQHTRSLRGPSTPQEDHMIALWAKTVNTDPSTIGPNDSFFDHNGDSILAMKLVSFARKDGLPLNVATVLQHPILSDMVAQVSISSARPSEPFEIAPFSIIRDPGPPETLQAEISISCHLEDLTRVQDAYPCTPLQESMLAALALDPLAFVSTSIYTIPVNVEIDRLRRSWSTLLSSNSILRTRMVNLRHHGLMQCVVKDEIDWRTYASVLECTESFGREPFGLGTPLVRWAIVDNGVKTEMKLVWYIHHALYDAWTLSLLERQLRACFESSRPQPVGLDLRPLVNDIQHQKVAEQEMFWATELRNTGQDAIYPPSPKGPGKPKADAVSKKLIEFPSSSSRPGPINASIVYASWALMVSRNTGCKDVVFGSTLSGRNAPINGIERIVGPTITTVPIRISVLPSQTAHDFLQTVRDSSIHMIPFEHYGLQNIRRINRDCEAACSFQTMFVVQHEDDSIENSNSSISNGTGTGRMTDLLLPYAEGDSTHLADQLAAFGQYSMLIEVRPLSNGFEANVSFDSTVTSSVHMERLLDQWKTALQELWSAVDAKPRCTIQSLSIVSNEDLKQIWSWNHHVPVPAEDGVLASIAKHVSLRPDAIAIHGWDQELSYAQLDTSSSKLARILVRNAVRAGSCVPLLFEKSALMPVAMLAVAKVGASFAPLDADHPETRLMATMQIIEAKMILCSAQTVDLAAKLSSNVVVAAEATILAPLIPLRDLYDQTSRPEDIMYTTFTSGSTGQPKGVHITNANLATAVHHQAAALGFGQATRSLDSSSYSFDACIFNTFYTLSQGGCLCVPKTLDNLTESITHFKVNLAQLTPSLSRILDPELIKSSLKTLILTGEPLSRGDIQAWAHHVHLINVYGPTECSIMCSGAINVTMPSRARNVGRGLGANLWLVDVDDSSRLAAIGCVGEILIEGPLVGAGYLNDQANFMRQIVSDPPWLLAGVAGADLGRQGDLFRTGDLAKYEEDGSLVYVGRKEGEIKIRGQRIDVADVETNLRQLLPLGCEVTVEIIELSPDLQSAPQEVLLAFITLAEGGKSAQRYHLRGLVPELSSKLGLHVPSHMRPAVYVSLDRMPKTPSGKTHRKRLRELAKKLQDHDLIQASGEMLQRRTQPSKPFSPMEKTVATWWANVLKLESHAIDLNDNFFSLGGDSIRALHLVAMAHAEGIGLTPKQVFETPILSTLAASISISRQSSDAHKEAFAYLPFSLLPGDIGQTSSDRETFIRSAVLPELGMAYGEVADIYPANGFQTDCMESRHEPFGLQYAYIDVGPRTDWERLQAASRAVVQSIECLRGRFIKHDDVYYHVILKEAPLILSEREIDESMASFFANFCTEDSHAASLCDIFTKFTLVNDTAGNRRLIMRLSHAHEDGFSTNQIFEGLAAAYNGQALLAAPAFSHLLHHREQTRQASQSYWRSILNASSLTPLPQSPSESGVRTLRTRIMPRFHTFKDNRRTRPTVVVNVAWALILAEANGRDDIVFGNVTTGRNGAMAQLHKVVGPCVNMVPVRLRVPEHGQDRQQHLRDLVDASASQVDGRLPYEGLDWKEIVDSCTDWARGSHCMSSIHFRDLEPDAVLTFATPSPAGKVLEEVQVKWYEPAITPSWTTILIHPEEEDLRLWVYADPKVVSKESADQLLERLVVNVKEILVALGIVS